MLNFSKSSAVISHHVWLLIMHNSAFLSLRCLFHFQKMLHSELKFLIFNLGFESTFGLSLSIFWLFDFSHLNKICFVSRSCVCVLLCIW